MRLRGVRKASWVDPEPINGASTLLEPGVLNIVLHCDPKILL
jgi:hypothetical protein